MSLKSELSSFYYEMNLNELRLMNEHFVSANLTYNSLLYLDLVALKENCTVSYLADKLHISKSAVTLKIGELLKQGFIEKKQSEKDKRIFYLSITKKLSKEYEFYDKKLGKIVKKIESEFSLDEVKNFIKMLKIISNCYKEGDKNG